MRSPPPRGISGAGNELFGVLLLLSLLAFGGAMFLPKWLESQSARGAIAGPGAPDDSRPDNASPHER